VISFRYHVVSIVAVFLALAIGILLGSTFLNAGLADRLDSQVKNLSASLDRERSAISDLQDQVQSATAYMQATLPSAVAGRLTGEPVVIVTDANVDLTALAAARHAVSAAGATVGGVVEIRPTLLSADPADQTALAQILGVTSASPPTDLIRRAAEALAQRLTQAPAAGAPDLLAALDSAGLLSVVDQTPAGLAGIGVPGQTVVIVSGGTQPPAVDPTTFLVALAEALVATQPPTPVVAAQPQDAATAFVPAIRASSVDGQLVTVDDVNLTPGQFSVVVGLQDLIRDPGRGADYGLKPGATAPFATP